MTSIEPNDPLDGVKKIGDALGKVAAEIGLQMHTFAVVPDFTGTSHVIQAVFMIDEDKLAPAAPVDEEQAKVDAEFKRMEDELLREAAKEAEAAKMSDAGARMLELQRRLQDGKSILGDD